MLHIKHNSDHFLAGLNPATNPDLVRSSGGGAATAPDASTPNSSSDWRAISPLSMRHAK